MGSGSNTNGDNAEHWAEIAANNARQASESARASADAAMKTEHHLGLFERKVDELSAMFRNAIGRIDGINTRLKRVEVTGAGGQGAAGTAATLTHEDWVETDTGSWKLTKDKFERFTAAKELERDANRWRGITSKFGVILVGALSAGGGIGAWELVKWLLHLH